MRIVKKNSELRMRKVGRAFLAVFCLFSLFIFQVALGNAFSGQGEELRNLEQKKQQLLRENENLRTEIAYLGSLERIRQTAEEELLMVESGSRLDYLVPPKLAWR
jgi:cell division protein FtsL